MSKRSSACVVVVLSAFALGAVAGCAAPPLEEEETQGTTEQAIVPVAIVMTVGACLTRPPCAAAVFAVLGYTVQIASEIRAADRNRAQRAANDWATSSSSAASSGDQDPDTGCREHVFEPNEKHRPMPIDGPTGNGFISWGLPNGRTPYFSTCTIYSPTLMTCPLIHAGEQWTFTCRRHIPGGKGRGDGAVCKFHCYVTQ